MSATRKGAKAASRRSAIVWSQRALADVREIDEYIAADDPIAAERWVAKLVAAVERAAAVPLAGRVVPELRRREIREVFVRTYRVVYRLESNTLEVVTIFEGHRSFPITL